MSQRKQYPRLRRSHNYSTLEDAKRELVRCGYIDAFSPPGDPGKWVRIKDPKAFAIAKRSGARTYIIVAYPTKEEIACLQGTTHDTGEPSSNVDEKESLNDSEATSMRTAEPADSPSTTVSAPKMERSAGTQDASG